MSAVIDLVGRRFGRLRVVARAPNAANGKARFACACDCGGAVVVHGRDLRAAHTKSCGCWRVEAPSLAFTTHGMRQSPEYRIWGHVKTRCFNTRSKFYARYGGRGIGMCVAWTKSFEAFYRDMGPRPSPRHSIDRIDNDGPYDPGNCRWATPFQQAANRSTVRLLTVDGVSDTLSGWSRRSGVSYLKLRRRIEDGWAPERAVEAKDAAVRARLFTWA